MQTAGTLRFIVYVAVIFSFDRSESKNIEISVERLDEQVHEDIALLKIDVEGFEVRASCPHVNLVLLILVRTRCLRV